MQNGPLASIVSNIEPSQDDGTTKLLTTLVTPANGMIHERAFLNLRLPRVQFQWNIVSPLCDVRSLVPGRVCEVQTAWSSFSKEGDFNTGKRTDMRLAALTKYLDTIDPLVATGTIRDTLIVLEGGRPLIANRLFMTHRVLQSRPFQPSQLKGQCDISESSKYVHLSHPALPPFHSLTCWI